MFTGEKTGLLGRAPEREQDEREAEGRAGDKLTSPTSHPMFTAAFTLRPTFQRATGVQSVIQNFKVGISFIFIIL